TICLPNIAPESYQQYHRLSTAANRGPHPLKNRTSQKRAEAYDAAVKAGILTGGQSVGEVAARMGQGYSANPFSTNFAPVRAVRKGGEMGENFLRGSQIGRAHV